MPIGWWRVNGRYAVYLLTGPLSPTAPGLRIRHIERTHPRGRAGGGADDAASIASLVGQTLLIPAHAEFAGAGAITTLTTVPQSGSIEVTSIMTVKPHRTCMTVDLTRPASSWLLLTVLMLGGVIGFPYRCRAQSHNRISARCRSKI